MQEYIEYRVKLAGGQKSLFANRAMPNIYEYTGGIPRLINSLCDTCLLCGYAEGAKTINKTVVEEAIKELGWKPFNERFQRYSDSETDRW